MPKQALRILGSQSFPLLGGPDLVLFSLCRGSICLDPALGDVVVVGERQVDHSVIIIDVVVDLHDLVQQFQIRPDLIHPLPFNDRNRASRAAFQTF